MSTAPAFFQQPVHLGPVDVIAAPQLAELEDAAAHLRAIMDLTRAKDKAEAVAIVAAKVEQLKRAYSTIDYIATRLRVPSHKVSDAVEHAIQLLSDAYPRCASCDAWIADGTGCKLPDPGHCGGITTDAPLVTYCTDCASALDLDTEGGLSFERARR